MTWVAWTCLEYHQIVADVPIKTFFWILRLPVAMFDIFQRTSLATEAHQGRSYIDWWSHWHTVGGCEILHHQKDGWSPINGYFTINSWWLYVIMIVLTCFNHIIHGIIHGMCFLVGCFFATVFNCYGAIPYQGPLSIIVHVQVLKESERSRTKSVFFSTR